jgi:hypothetical protein
MSMEQIRRIYKVPAHRARCSSPQVSEGAQQGKQTMSHIDEMKQALSYAEAALSDIGDATREPSDDLAWCEARAAAALPRIRAAIAAAEQAEPRSDDVERLRAALRYAIKGFSLMRAVAENGLVSHRCACHEVAAKKALDA